jgi:hypothetical protein
MRITNTREVHMSWFKKAPVKNPPKPKNTVHPHKTSPISEKALKEAKKTGPDKKVK